MRPLVVAVVLLVILPSVSAAQGILARVRSYTGNSSFPSNSSGTNNVLSGLGNLGGSSDADGLALGGLIVATSPFWVPYALFDGGQRFSGWFLPYPYSRKFDEGGSGYMAPQDPPRDDDFDWAVFNWDNPERDRSWAWRSHIDVGDNFSQLSRTGGQLFVDGPYRLALMADWDYYLEKLQNGGYDHTNLGEANALFRVAQSPGIQFYSGLGIRMQVDPAATHTGFNFVYRVDLFPIKPWHASTVAEIGNLNDALVWHLRTEVGANYRFLEFFTGYDFLRIHTANLQGPFLGLRVWF